MKLTDFDKNCLITTIKIASEAQKVGNYPVGAILVIDKQIIDQAGNQINQKKSFVSHAENSLIIKNGIKLYQAWKDNKEIILYSTLEPCIQCLGAAVTNHVNKIFYIQKDPNGGACNLQHNNIGVWYQEVWPEIIYSPISHKPLEMMITFFKNEIKKGNIDWPTKMLKLLSNKNQH